MKTTHQVLVNPFKPGDTIKVPAGAVFSTDDRRYSRFNHTSERGFTIKNLEFSTPGGVTHLGDEPYPYAGRLQFVAARGYYKYVDINEDIVFVNGHTPEYFTAEHTPLSEQ